MNEKEKKDFPNFRDEDSFTTNFSGSDYRRYETTYNGNPNTKYTSIMRIFMGRAKIAVLSGIVLTLILHLYNAISSWHEYVDNFLKSPSDWLSFQLILIISFSFPVYFFCGYTYWKNIVVRRGAFVFRIKSIMKESEGVPLTKKNQDQVDYDRSELHQANMMILKFYSLDLLLFIVCIVFYSSLFKN